MNEPFAICINFMVALVKFVKSSNYNPISSLLAYILHPICINVKLNIVFFSLGWNKAKFNLDF